MVKIPRSFFLESSINHALRESEGEILLYDVFNQILVALMNAGYHDFMCYAVPDGFALATRMEACLLYTSDAADDLPCVDLGGRRIIKKKKHLYLLIHRTNLTTHSIM